MLSLCATATHMKTEKLDNLKDLYRRWIAAKNRYEMSSLMNTNEEHKDHFKKLYKELSNELHDALIAYGCTTKRDMELTMNNLADRKPKLTLISGGKSN